MKVKKEIFNRKIPVNFQQGNFLVKTLENFDDIEKLFEFRKRIFQQVGYISDDRPLSDLDFMADHLAVIDSRSESIIASYILLSSTDSNTFNADKRWSFDEFKYQSNQILELSWLCVSSRYANKRIWLNQLLKGIIEYSIISGDYYYFGSVSIPHNDKDTVAQIAYYLEKNDYTDHQFNIVPKSDITLPKVTPMSYWGDEAVKPLIPKLLFWYFKLGIRCAPKPVVLPHVSRTDFFIYGKAAQANKLYHCLR